MPNVWKLEQVSDTKCGTNVSNEKLLNGGEFLGYGFSKLLRENQQGEG